MYSILDKVDKHIKEKGINLRKINISYECLPDYINQAILYTLRNLDQTFSLGREKYQLKYDENNVLHLEVFSDSGHSRLLICNNPLGFNTKIPGYVMSEKKIVEIACILKSLRKKQLKLRTVLASNNPDKNYLERLKMEYMIISSWVKEEISLRRDLGDSILEEEDYERLLYSSTEKIIEAIDYVNDYYVEKFNQKNNSLDFDIVFVSNGDEKESNGFTSYSSNTSRERVNGVIPLEDRKNALEKYSYIFSANGHAENNEKLDFLCYLYKIKQNRFLLILEPVSGVNYTKMVIIDGINYISSENFVNIARKYLEFTPEQMLECDNAIRTTHTTLSNFLGNVGYAITGEEKEISSPYVRKRIMELRKKGNNK